MSNLQDYFNSRELTSLDTSFGEMIARRSGKDTPDPIALKLLAAMSLSAIRNSDSCLDLKRWAERPSGNPDCLPSPCTPEEWVEKCGKWTTAIAVEKDGLVPNTPLVLCGQRVYLHRYRLGEHRIRDFVRNALNRPSPEKIPSKDDIHNSCGYFTDSFENDWQQKAVQMALSNHFSIVTGGPGTGKTTVLSVILLHEFARNPSLRVRLCAPTGKAAARMTEAIASEINNLKILNEETKQRLVSLKASTIHTLLGLNEFTNLPKYNAQNPLTADLVVVDECSMCSLMLLSQLTDALNYSARLLLLGDKDQLASVESGIVFGDLCHWAENYHPKCITYLTKSHRFDSDSALGRFVLATVKRADDAPDYDSLYKTNDVFRAQELNHKLKENELEGVLATLLAKMGIDRKNWRKAVQEQACNSPEDEQQLVRVAYNRTEQFKVLCALREGMLGMVNMNKVIASLLNMKPQDDGAPVLVLRNDPVTGLLNGDTGVWFRGKIWFPDPPKTDPDTAVPPSDNPAGEYWNRHFTAYFEALLPEHETAFAMTIHKSQGSGYKNVIVTLPFQDNPILTRELVYTSMTRTREKCFLLAKRELLESAIERPTERSTGLRELLREGDVAEGGFAPAVAIQKPCLMVLSPPAP